MLAYWLGASNAAAGLTLLFAILARDALSQTKPQSCWSSSLSSFCYLVPALSFALQARNLATASAASILFARVAFSSFFWHLRYETTYSEEVDMNFTFKDAKRWDCQRSTTSPTESVALMRRLESVLHPFHYLDAADMIFASLSNMIVIVESGLRAVEVVDATAYTVTFVIYCIGAVWCSLAVGFSREFDGTVFVSYLFDPSFLLGLTLTVAVGGGVVFWCYAWSLGDVPCGIVERTTGMLLVAAFAVVSAVAFARYGVARCRENRKDNSIYDAMCALFHCSTASLVVITSKLFDYEDECARATRDGRGVLVAGVGCVFGMLAVVVLVLDSDRKELRHRELYHALLFVWVFVGSMGLCILRWIYM